MLAKWFVPIGSYLQLQVAKMHPAPSKIIPLWAEFVDKPRDGKEQNYSALPFRQGSYGKNPDYFDMIHSVFGLYCKGAGAALWFNHALIGQAGQSFREG